MIINRTNRVMVKCVNRHIGDVVRNIEKMKGVGRRLVINLARPNKLKLYIIKTQDYRTKFLRKIKDEGFYNRLGKIKVYTPRLNYLV